MENLNNMVFCIVIWKLVIISVLFIWLCGGVFEFDWVKFNKLIDNYFVKFK